jgi:hypothetical protein
VDKHDSVIFPQALKSMTQSLEKAAIELKKGAVFNLDPAFDSKNNILLIEKATCEPNIKVNPRKSKTKKPVAPDQEAYKNRYVNERIFAWQDKFRRTIIRWETKAKNFFSFFVLSLAMVNLRLII